MTEPRNHTVSGTRATAETRSAHPSLTPPLAEPSPSARARGERISLLSTVLSRQEQADRPGRHCKRHAAPDDRPSGDVDRPQLETVNGVPDQVADAAAQVQEEGEGEAEQHDPAAPGGADAMYRAVGSWPHGRRGQPDDQANG